MDADTVCAAAAVADISEPVETEALQLVRRRLQRHPQWTEAFESVVSLCQQQQPQPGGGIAIHHDNFPVHFLAAISSDAKLVGQGMSGRVFLVGGVAVKVSTLRPGHSFWTRVRYLRHSTDNMRALARHMLAPRLLAVYVCVMDDVPYFVQEMEYIRGKTLDEVVMTADVRRAVEKLQRACAQAGVSHNDVNPGNVIVVDKNGSVRAMLIDFDLSKTSWQQAEMDLEWLFNDRDVRTTLERLVLAGTLRPPLFSAAENMRSREVVKATRVLVEGLIARGHRVLDVRAVHNSRLQALYDKERASMPSNRRRMERLLFHTTSTTAGDAISREGFAEPRRTGAFGRGINLTNGLGQATMYTSDRMNSTLVCRALVGKAHNNDSMDDPMDPDNTKPVHVRPMKGYDSFVVPVEGGEDIVVIPRRRRVLPLAHVQFHVQHSAPDAALGQVRVV
jgi:predicted Ser/Thr protein kinase